MDAEIGARQLVGVYDKALIRDNSWKAFLKWYPKLSFNALRASLKYRLGLS
jgi:L-ribulose-5-phosphate 3-epimerase UlaE